MYDEEARNSALREVAKLLPLPGYLQSTTSLKADYTQRLLVNDVQLNASMQSVLEDARAGEELLSKSQNLISELRESLATINRLCEECSSLIDNHDLINVVNFTQINLDGVLKDVAGVLSIPEEAAAVIELLKDDRELLNAYEVGGAMIIAFGSACSWVG
eukprot:jgi/Mesvir1/26592/Mv05555-RA.1